MHYASILAPLIDPANHYIYCNLNLKSKRGISVLPNHTWPFYKSLDIRLSLSQAPAVQILQIVYKDSTVLLYGLTKSLQNTPTPI